MPKDEPEREIQPSSNKSEEEEDPFDIFQEDSFSLSDDEDEEDEVDSDKEQPPQKSATPAVPEPATSHLGEAMPLLPLNADKHIAEDSNTFHMVKPADEGINSIPITLAFEMGRVEIPLQTLTELVPGYTLNLEQSMEKEVTLIANGKAIGIGELLQIGDVLGIRIVKINN